MNAPFPLARRLYVRIWLAMVLALAVLALLAAWLWRIDDDRRRAERPAREILITNAAGQILGQAPARPVRNAGTLEFEVPLKDGQTLYVQLPRPRRAGPPGAGEPGAGGGAETGAGPGAGPGMGLGATAALPPHRRRPPEPWRPSMPGFLGMLALVSVVLALATYPVVRRLTQRLERLQQGVQRWGEGDLSVRLPVQGQDEVAFLAQRFNAAADRVQALLRAHQRLLANASHELRSPLARIRMGLELLERADSATQAAQRAELARSIAELDALVDEILLASRLDLAEAPLTRPEAVDLTALAAEECARVQAELHVQAQPRVWGEERLLRRLLRNLLENARRYSRPFAAVHPTAHRAGAAAQGGQGAGEGLAEAYGGKSSGVRLSLAVQQAEGRAWAVVTVDDNGPGVPPAQRERIFEPFYRLPGASEHQGGVGLGLALVRQIAQHHGGTVVCSDSPLGGARLVVRLPLHGEGAAA